MNNLTVGPGLQSIGTATEWSGQAVDALVSEGGNFARRDGVKDRRHQMRVNEAARLMAAVIQGQEDPALLREAMFPRTPYMVEHLQKCYPLIFRESVSPLGLRETMSYSDYSALTVDILDRVLYGYYTDAPIETLPLVKQVPLRDFRLVARYTMDGGVTPYMRMPSDTTLTPHGAGEPPTERAMQQAAREVEGSTQRVTYQPQLYQAMMSVNWRALVNDDLGIFNDQTQRLAIGGRRTIAQFITSLYVSSTGYNTTLYNSTFRNLITTTYGAASNNPALSLDGLQDAFAVLSLQKDLDGQPIQFDGQLYLVTGPGRISMTAKNLLKTVQGDLSVYGGTTNAQGFPSQRIRIDPWMVQNIVHIEDKWIPIVDTTAATAANMWFLTYAPSAQARPSLELGQLRGFETPQLYQKMPNTMRVGGGVDPMMGDFYTMDQSFKGVLVLGGAPLDGRSTVVSTGAGS